MLRKKYQSKEYHPYSDEWWWITDNLGLLFAPFSRSKTTQSQIRLGIEAILICEDSVDVLFRWLVFGTPLGLVSCIGLPSMCYFSRNFDATFSSTRFLTISFSSFFPVQDNKKWQSETVSSSWSRKNSDGCFMFKVA